LSNEASAKLENSKLKGMPIFENGNIKTYYELHGSGPALLMIAGMASDSKSWQYILKGLAQHHRVIVFDNRGCGRTLTDNRTFDLKDLAADAVALLEFLKYEKVNVVGHSMGGMIAQEMALAYPEKIDRLILASSSPQFSDQAKGILDDLYDQWHSGCEMADWFKILFQYLFTKEALSNKNFMDAAIIFALNYPYPQTIEGFREQKEAIEKFNASSRIRKIMHSCLILSGNEDILIPSMESKLLEGIGGKTKFKIIEGAAHSIHAEKPKAFSEAVLGFLTS